LPYFQTDLTTVDGAPKAMGGGASDVLTLWLDEGERLTVGTLYRTPDRRFTLSSLNALTLFSGITLETLVDGVHTNSQSGGASREYTFPAVSGPGSITFTYAKTIHRARLALGEGLDVSSIDTVNAQLIPDLPVGSGPLQITLNGPPSPTDSGSSSPNVGGDGPAAAGDFVGQRWYPTKPGTFQIQWPDQNGYTNTIEVASDFPTEPETRSGFFAFELDTGFRQGMPPQYVYTNTFNPVETRFPGAPAAHYPYALAQEGSYRADLDPSSADSSRLTRMSFTENNSATLTSTRLFTDTVASNRSVVVYSRRTNTLQTATGDLSRETVTVRVIQSRNLSTNASAVVGTKLVSAYDTARLGSGEITTDSKNYNPGIYVTNRDVGQWGPVFPVNRYKTDKDQSLTVGWYDAPSVTVPGEPRGYIPSMSVTYTSIDFPDAAVSPVLYISSQMGTEGVGQAVATDGKPNYQEIFDPARVASLAIYNQPASGAIGYNPNEEHAFIAPSKAYTLTGDPRFNLGQSAAFALQKGLNVITGKDYTSDPFVLVQFAVVGATNASDAFAMRAYAVKTVRNGADSFPATDPTTHTAFDPSGQPVTQPANPKYDFEYATLAGNPVLPPYPLNLVIGNAVLTNTLGGNVVFTNTVGAQWQRTLWQDRVGNYWAVSGGGQFFLRYWYPYRADFWMGKTPPAVGTPLAWVPENTRQGDLESLMAASTRAVAAIYDAYWGNTYPVLKKG
ncbi:MAG: hypothetical protein ACO3I0_16345, partial [Limisphaerales bacterium]